MDKIIGPFTFDLYVHVQGADGSIGSVTVGLSPGNVPTLESIHKAIGQALEALPEGYSLMEPDNFVSKLIHDRTGDRRSREVRCEAPPKEQRPSNTLLADVRQWADHARIPYADSGRVLKLCDEIERLQRLVDALRRERDMSASVAGRALTELHEKVTAPEPAAESALRNCLLLALRNLHVKHPDSLAAKNWEAIVRFCKEGGIEPSSLRESRLPKPDHCEVCSKQLPPASAWSMPSCPDCQELLEGLGQLMGDFADRDQTIKAGWIERAINLICARPSKAAST